MSKSGGAPSLRTQLIKTFENPNYRPPPLPNIAIELQMLAAKEDASIEEIVRVLEKDEMLAGSVVRLVGSPLYAGRGPVRSLREAVIRLGVRTVRDVVFDASLRRGVFEVPEYKETIAQIGRHSRATAYIARTVCKQARISEDMVFLCGLLHDIGFAAILFAAARAKVSVPLAEMWAEVDSLHEQGSKLVTKLWGLPAELSTIVGAHHHLHTGATSRMAAVINLADHLTAQFSLAIVGPPDAEGNPMPADAVTTVEVSDSLSVLSLDEAAVQRIAAEAGPAVSAIATDE
jgi:HD-like signal output (HDOD) protein